MQVEVNFLTRRGEAVMHKSQTVTAENLRIGRGTDNEVQLPDIRVALRAATLHPIETGLFLEQVGDAPLRVNGVSVGSALVQAGDKIQIGPYELILLPPAAGQDAALSVELVQPLGDALERLMTQSRIGLDRAGLKKRRTSWLFFLAFLVLGLAVPALIFPFGRVVPASKSAAPSDPLSFVSMSWNSGELSNQHRFFAQDCATCHRGAFARVPDSACLSCHATVGNHLDAAVASISSARHAIESTRCAQCHEEHRGLDGLVINAAKLCVDCHRNMTTTAPASDVRNVSGYPKGHPGFRVTLVADPAAGTTVRVPLEAAAAPGGSVSLPLDGARRPTDHPNLTFSHAAHLTPKGFLTPSGFKIMACADCHVPDPSGQEFMPITFEGQCHSCHDLKFDADLPWREVPHGDAAVVRNAVDDFYAHMALQGGSLDPDAPALARRPVGTPMPAGDTERMDALAWAQQRANVALGIIFDDKRGCAYCHVTDRRPGVFTVAPPVLRARFMPAAHFDHAKHSAMNCDDCHASRQSDSSSDVLIPNIETCLSCHGPERAALKTRSTCTTCHLFHRPEFGPMRNLASAHP